MKNVMKKVKNVTKNSIQKVIYAANVTALAIMYPSNVYAKANTMKVDTKGIGNAMEYLGNGVMAVGGLFIVFGIVHAAMASSEGDGPAKQKAMHQIGGGVATAIVGAAFKTIFNLIIKA